MDDILLGDATDQLAALAARRVGARELLQAVLERTDRLNPTINAVVARDVDRAMAEATAVDAARARGDALGPLAGLPMTVKDIFDVEGLPASTGLRSRLGRAAADAEAVARVRAAGALVWGHTNVPAGSSDFQTFNALYGLTRNPWDPSKTAGGSSGGSAAAVAARLSALEIGADMGGSLRIPASYCGVSCHRPSWGLVSQRGIASPPGYLADYDLLVDSPMARSVRDLQLALTVLAGLPPAPAPSPRDLRIGLWVDESAFAIDPSVRVLIDDFAVALRKAGVAIGNIASPLPACKMLSTYMTLLLAALSGTLPSPARAAFELIRGPARIARACGAGPLSWAQGVLGYTARHSEWLAASEERARLKAALGEVFATHDAILAPVTPTPAFPHDTTGHPSTRRLLTSDGRRIPYLAQIDWIALAIVCDLPATVIPVGLTSDGLPVGVQVIGRPGADASTLGIAAALEALTGPFPSPPIG